MLNLKNSLMIKFDILSNKLLLPLCFLIMIFLFLSCAKGGFHPVFSTPEDTWRTFAQAVREANYSLVLACYEKGDYTSYKDFSDKETVDEMSRIFKRINFNFIEKKHIFGYEALLVHAKHMETGNEIKDWVKFRKVGDRYLISSLEMITKDWETKETENIRFFYRKSRMTEECAEQMAKGSPRMKEIFGWRDSDFLALEEFYKKASGYLGMSRKKIDYYLVSSRDEYLAFTNITDPYRDSAEFYTAREDRVISMSTYSTEEIAHALTKDLGSPPVAFKEGIADFLTMKFDPENILDYDKELLKYIEQGKFINLDEIVEDYHNLDVFVRNTEMTLFISYIIDKYGLNTFKELYSEMDDTNYHTKILEKYDKTIKELQDSWINDLKEKMGKKGKRGKRGDRLLFD